MTQCSRRGDDRYFFSAGNGYRGRSRLNFQIDHIPPMSQRGKTTLDNMQLLTRQENGAKGIHREGDLKKGRGKTLVRQTEIV